MELQEAIHISVYLCTIYGIVIIEVYKCNKELYLLVKLYPSSFRLTPKESRYSIQECLILSGHQV